MLRGFFPFIDLGPDFCQTKINTRRQQSELIRKLQDLTGKSSSLPNLTARSPTDFRVGYT